MAPSGEQDAALPPVIGTGVWERRAPREYPYGGRPSSTGLEFRCRHAYRSGHLCGGSANCFDCDFNPFVGPGSSQFVYGYPDPPPWSARAVATPQRSPGRNVGDTFGGVGPSDDRGPATWELVPAHVSPPPGTDHAPTHAEWLDGELRRIGFIPVRSAGSANVSWFRRR